MKREILKQIIWPKPQKALWDTAKCIVATAAVAAATFGVTELFGMAVRHFI